MRSRVDGSRVLLDAIVTALIVAGVAKLETLPEEKVLVSLVRNVTVKSLKTAAVAVKWGFYGVKGYKGYVTLRRDLDAIQEKWKHVTDNANATPTLSDSR